VKVAAQQPVSATLARIALILAIVITAMVLSSRWPSSGPFPALGATIPMALLWGWAEFRLYRTRRAERQQLKQMKMVTGSMAHDLRTPLCTAMNAVGNLREATRQERPDPERIERSYAAAEKSLQRCHHLISAVLDYSRNGHNHLQVLEIDPWLAKVVEEFPLPEGIHLRTLFETQVRAAFAPCQMRRAVHNLMENATQAMTAEKASTGGPQLEVTSRIRRNQVEISIRDNGPGISAEEQSKVFTPLYTGRKGGVGLGLAIVEDVVRQHDGTVKLTSTPGEGSTFTLRLPSL
jgi:two-component system sensor histidine kinase FlrB